MLQVRGRRSIWRMVPEASTLPFSSLLRICGRLMCGGPHQPPPSPPFDMGLAPAGGASSLLFFVHRVEGLPQGARQSLSGSTVMHLRFLSLSSPLPSIAEKSSCLAFLISSEG